ncbi:MAG TPA: MFS transporter [Blastocatellia bacterium]
MDQALFGYAIPAIMSEFKIGISTIGVILSVSFVFSALSVVVIGLLTDQIGRRKAFVGCLAISAVLVGCQYWAATLAALVILRTASFGVSSGLSPITNTYTVEAAPPRYRGILTGVLQCGTPIGWFLASLVAVPLLKSYGWRAMFLPAFAVSPLALLLYRYLPESKRFEKRRHTSAGAGERNSRSGGALKAIAELFKPHLFRRTVCCFLAFFMFGGAYSGTAFYFPKFFSEVRGYSEAEATMRVGLSYGIGVIGYVVASLIGEFRLTRRNTVVIWVSTGSLAFLGVTWLSTSYWSGVFWFGLMTMFFYGTSAVSTTLATEIFPTKVRATGAAFSASFALYLGFAVFPVLMARAIGAWGWLWAFTFIGAPPLLLCALFTLALPNLPSGVDVDDLLA